MILHVKFTLMIIQIKFILAISFLLNCIRYRLRFGLYRYDLKSSLINRVYAKH